MTGEFRHQTVTQTFLVTPDRGRVVAAKLVAYPLAGIALALTTLATTAIVAVGWLAAKGITPSVSPSVFDARLGPLQWFGVVGVTLLAAGLCGLVGVGVGAHAPGRPQRHHLIAIVRAPPLVQAAAPGSAPPRWMIMA
jgi:hypothetical protein